MKTLEIPREEAIEILESDKEIDKGKKLFELTPEQKKTEKKMKNAGVRTVDAYGKARTRTRPADEDKRTLIKILESSLQNVQDLTVTREEGQLDFRYNGRRFRIMLSAPRK